MKTLAALLGHSGLVTTVHFVLLRNLEAWLLLGVKENDYCIRHVLLDNWVRHWGHIVITNMGWNWKKMKINAVVFVNCEVGEEAESIEALRLVKGVTEVIVLKNSAYTCIVKVEGTTEEVRNIVWYGIRKAPYIRATMTLMVKSSWSLK